MTNTVRIYDRAFKPCWSGTIGTAAQAVGLWYDGLLWYLLDDTSDTLEAYVLRGGTFYLVRTLFTGLPSGYTSPQGLTGDGRCIYVFCTNSAGTLEKALQYDKATGAMLKECYSEGVSSLGAVFDGDFDGCFLHIARTREAEPPEAGVVKVDRPSGVRTFSSPDTGRVLENYLFDGLHPVYGITIAGNRVTVSDEFYTSKLMRTSGALGQQAYDGCMLGDSSHEDSYLYDGFSDGGKFALVTRA